MRDFIAVGIVLLAATAAAAEIAPDSGLTGDLDGDNRSRPPIWSIIQTALPPTS